MKKPAMVETFNAVLPLSGEVVQAVRYSDYMKLRRYIGIKHPDKVKQIVEKIDSALVRADGQLALMEGE